MTKTLAVVPRRAIDRAADHVRGALKALEMRISQLVGAATQLSVGGRGFFADQEVAAGDFVVGTPAGSCSA